jgi:hypothetical protein
LRRTSSTMVAGLVLLISAAVPSVAMSTSIHGGLGPNMTANVHGLQPPHVGNPPSRGTAIDAHPSLARTPIAVPQMKNRCFHQRYAQLRILGHDIDLASAEAHLICG